MTNLVEYTDPSVFAGIAAGADWAEPIMDPTEIDWPQRQARAAIPVTVVDGRPVIPGPSTGVHRGRNHLGHWGEMQCADAIVLVTHVPMMRRLVGQIRRWILLIERGDGHGWAIPGGKLDAGETAIAGAVRELEEETGLVLRSATWTAAPARLVDDPRASDEAWMVTTPVIAEIRTDGSAGLPAVKGADDARRAEWLPADSYEVLCAALDVWFGGTVFRAHREMLAAILDGEQTR